MKLKTKRIIKWAIPGVLVICACIMILLSFAIVKETELEGGWKKKTVELTQNTAITSSVAFKGKDFGVAYVDVGGNDYEVYFKLVDKDGNIISTKKVTSTENFPVRPHLLYWNEEFSLIWAEMDKTNIDFYSLYFVLLNTNGNQIGDIVKVAENISGFEKAKFNFQDYTHVRVGNKYFVLYKKKTDYGEDIFVSNISAGKLSTPKSGLFKAGNRCYQDSFALSKDDLDGFVLMGNYNEDNENKVIFAFCDNKGKLKKKKTMEDYYMIGGCPIWKGEDIAVVMYKKPEPGGSNPHIAEFDKYGNFINAFTIVPDFLKTFIYASSLNTYVTEGNNLFWGDGEYHHLLLYANYGYYIVRFDDNGNIKYKIKFHEEYPGLINFDSYIFWEGGKYSIFCNKYDESMTMKFPIYSVIGMYVGTINMICLTPSNPPYVDINPVKSKYNVNEDVFASIKAHSDAGLDSVEVIPHNLPPIVFNNIGGSDFNKIVNVGKYNKPNIIGIGATAVDIYDNSSSDACLVTIEQPPIPIISIIPLKGTYCVGEKVFVSIEIKCWVNLDSVTISAFNFSSVIKNINNVNFNKTICIGSYNSPMNVVVKVSAIDVNGNSISALCNIKIVGK